MGAKARCSFRWGGDFGFGEGARVDDEVYVALAVAEFDVFEAVVLVGQREHGLGEEGEVRDVDGELAGARAEEMAADADVVAEIEELVERETLLADGVKADVNLQALALLLEGGKAGFALSSDTDGREGGETWATIER